MRNLISERENTKKMAIFADYTEIIFQSEYNLNLCPTKSF